MPGCETERWDQAIEAVGRSLVQQIPLSCFSISTFLIAALNAAPGLLAHFFNEERCLARRAGFWNRTIPEGKFALRIPAACVKRTPLSRALLNQVSTAPGLGTLDAEGKWLRGLALRIR